MSKTSKPSGADLVGTFRSESSFQVPNSHTCKVSWGTDADSSLMDLPKLKGRMQDDKRCNEGLGQQYIAEGCNSSSYDRLHSSCYWV